MKALTLWQPWNWLIARGHKPVENRVWAPPDYMCGKPIALHAGLSHDGGALDFATEALVKLGEVDAAVDLMMREVEKNHVRGAVEAVAMLAGAVHIDGCQLRAVANLGSEVHAMRAHPFAVGPWCWVFAGVRALPEPVPCRGFQGLWELPEDVESAVLAQLGGQHG